MDHSAQLRVGNATVLNAEIIGQLGDFLLGQTNDAAQLLTENVDELGLCSESDGTFDVYSMLST